MRQLLAEIDSAELTEWLAFYRIDPFGDQRGDVQSATVARMVYLANCDKKAPTLSLKEFMPFLPPEPEQSPEDQMAMFKALTRNAGKKG